MIRPQSDSGDPYETSPSVKSTQTAVGPAGRSRRTHVLFVGHEASRTGAPILLLHLLRWLQRCSKLETRLLLDRSGPLSPDYAATIATWALETARTIPSGRFQGLPLVRQLIRRRKTAALKRAVRRFDPDVIYLNTAATGHALSFLDTVAPLVPVVVHVHELEFAISEVLGTESVRAILSRARVVIAASHAVATNLCQNHGLEPERVEVIHEFIPTDGPEPLCLSPNARRSLCEEFGLDPAHRFIGAVGTVEPRKGADLFVQVAQAVRRIAPDCLVTFLWLGEMPKGVPPYFLRQHLERGNLTSRVKFLGARCDPLRVMNLFDVFALTSREDPYPLAMLEAASLGKPIVCFEGAGGGPEFVESDCGFSTPFLDIEPMASRLIDLLSNDKIRAIMGKVAREKVSVRHSLSRAGSQVVNVIERVARQRP